MVSQHRHPCIPYLYRWSKQQNVPTRFQVNVLKAKCPRLPTCTIVPGWPLPRSCNVLWLSPITLYKKTGSRVCSSCLSTSTVCANQIVNHTTDLICNACWCTGTVHTACYSKWQRDNPAEMYTTDSAMACYELWAVISCTGIHHLFPMYTQRWQARFLEGTHAATFDVNLLCANWPGRIVYSVDCPSFGSMVEEMNMALLTAIQASWKCLWSLLVKR